MAEYVGATYQVARKSLKIYRLCASFLRDGNMSSPQPKMREMLTVSGHG